MKNFLTVNLVQLGDSEISYCRLCWKERPWIVAQPSDFQ